MANKKSLLGGVTIKVENQSGFDKSAFHAFTAPLGAIVPMRKQLLLPGSGKLSVKLSAQLPPLASDAFLRSHLKVEAFLVPMRLCYGGFGSWFSGEKISGSSGGPSSPAASLTTAQLPKLSVYLQDSQQHYFPQAYYDTIYGAHSLMDYFGVKQPIVNGHVAYSIMGSRSDFNIFPFVAYQLCYHHWYRNKLIQRPLFAPVSADPSSTLSSWTAGSLPYLSFSSIKSYEPTVAGGAFDAGSCYLLNGHLLQLRQRNYGFDYFTTALPSAQDGQPMTVDTSAGSFTISALRQANSLQHFAEVNQMSSPDFVQTCRARYGVAPDMGVAQRPILLGSADFPMFTSGVEQSAQGSPASPDGNPFAGMAARYGRAHAEGSDFVCEFNCYEPSYLMVMCSLVPEANYASGISKDMVIFTQAGSLTDLPCAELEQAGLEPIMSSEVDADLANSSSVFGYQPRYMWHKAGQISEVSGLFRKGYSLDSFIPQRDFNGWQGSPVISDAFLMVKPSDLDNITAVAGAISQYGVMIDSSVELYVSEPLGEGVMPSLVDPASEHGHSVYVKRGGLSVDN